MGHGIKNKNGSRITRYLAPSKKLLNEIKKTDRLELKKFNPILKKYTIHKEIK